MEDPKPPPTLPQTLPNTSPTPTQVSLQKPSHKKNPSKSTKLLKRFRSAFRSFPIITPAACKFPVSLHHHDTGHFHGGTRLTGTLFGHRKSRINLALQDKPKCLPMLVLELSIQTGKLLQDMGLGLVRIALECEKNRGERDKIKTKLMEEPIWSLYFNGKKMGYGVRREATEDDLNVMQMLHAVSMGAGVLPVGEQQDGELTYMRAGFERVVGSKDSETYYMINPDGNTPELTIFFVRV